MLVDDDDGVRYLFGESFVHTGNDDADKRIEDGVPSGYAMTLIVPEHLLISHLARIVDIDVCSLWTG
jgi:hypothetical protein